MKFEEWDLNGSLKNGTRERWQVVNKLQSFDHDCINLFKIIAISTRRKVKYIIVIIPNGVTGSFEGIPCRWL